MKSSTLGGGLDMTHSEMNSGVSLDLDPEECRNGRMERRIGGETKRRRRRRRNLGK